MVEEDPIDAGEDDDDGHKSLYIFGRDISAIPCFRKSWMVGISAGIGYGFAHFMATSDPKQSTRWGLRALYTTTLVYWFTCRYMLSKKNFETMQMQAAMQNMQLYEGTAIEKKIKGEIE